MNRGKLCLLWCIFLTYFGWNVSCTPDYSFDQNVEIIIQILLPRLDSVKEATPIVGIKNVTLTVTSGDEILTTKELDISGNTASGTISIFPGEDITFTAEAKDVNDYIQWKGSTNVNIVKDFFVTIDLTPIPPKSCELRAFTVRRTAYLFWTQNYDQDFARYELYRSEKENVLGEKIDSTIVKNETEFKDDSLLFNICYYTLIVFDTHELSSRSNVVRVEIIPPNTSKLMVDSLSSYSVKLSWTQNSNPDFARYELYRSQEENKLGDIIHSTTVVTDTAFDDTEVTEGSVYFYTLIVFDIEELSANSNVVRADIPFIPPTVSILSIDSISSSAIKLSWTKNSDMDFARYELYRSLREDEFGEIIYSTNVVTETAFNDIEVTEGSVYFYTLIVFDADELSANSNVVRIEFIPPTSSELSNSYVGSEGVLFIVLFWTQNPDSDFARYELYRSQVKGSLGTNIYSTPNVTDTVFVDTAWSMNNYYTLIVIDTVGLSSRSNVVEIIFLQ